MAKKNTLAKAFLFIIIAIIILAAPKQAEAKGINKKSITLAQNKSYTLKVNGKKKVKWPSKNKSVASVNSKGKVTARKPGRTSIIAKAGNKKYVCKVTVKKVAAKKVVAKKAVANNGTAKKTVTNSSSKPANSMTAKEQAIYNKLIAQKKFLPEGRVWTNFNYYRWNGGIFTGGYGCSSFAFRLSDAVFGTAPVRQHTNFNDIKVGDIVRLEYNTHSVVVLSISGNNLTVAEGNYNSSIHWERVIPLSHVKATGTYVMTRY